jgi:hypothetical protein
VGLGAGGWAARLVQPLASFQEDLLQPGVAGQWFGFWPCRQVERRNLTLQITHAAVPGAGSGEVSACMILVHQHQ